MKQKMPVSGLKLTLTSAHVTTGLEKHSCLFVRADYALLNLWQDKVKTQKQSTSIQPGFIIQLCTSGTDCTSASNTLVLDWTCSLQMRHFLTRGEQREQVAMCPQGPNRVSLFMSEHTIHSSSDSMLLFRDGLRVPTWLLKMRNTVCVRAEKQERFTENTGNRWRQRR